MTDIAQRALRFYLDHPEMVEQGESLHGHAHRVYACPDCSASVVLRDGELISLHASAGALVEEGISVEQVQKAGSAKVDSQDEGELVPC